MTAKANGSERCYSVGKVLLMLWYLPSHLIIFLIASIHMRAWRSGVSVVTVDARVMSPSEWQLHLRKFGVDAWLLWPPLDGGCEWQFAVRSRQANYARHLIAEAKAGRQPRPWGRKKAPRTVLG